MQLKIEEFPIATEIHFNFEEIKNEVADKMEFYKNVTYDETQLAEAKADRATLNKFINALDYRRKEIKDEILQPYKEFELRLNELKAIVEEPKQLIDAQIKAFEESAKEEKRQRITEIFKEEAGERDIDLFVIFDNRWLNKTYSEKDIREEIQAQVFNYDTNIPILEEWPDYSEEAVRRYKETMDMSKAIGEALRLKEEAEKRKAEEAVDKDKQKWRRLAVFASLDDMLNIEEYLNSAGINHRRIY